MQIIQFASSVEIILRRLYTRYIKKPESHSYVAMFHDVATEAVDKEGMSFSVTKYQFEKYLQGSKKNGKQFVDDVCSFPKMGRDGILLTFDDGLKSVEDVVLPICRELGIPFTVFVVTGYVEKEGYLSWKSLMNVAKDPLVTIGSHSVSHPMFRELSVEKKEEELKDSKKALEDRLEIEINDFAFPYGSLQAVDRESCKMASKIYRRIYVTRPTVFSEHLFLKRGHNYEIPRIDMSHYLKGGQFDVSCADASY